jgi:CheY-like chemotaxis protein
MQWLWVVFGAEGLILAAIVLLAYISLKVYNPKRILVVEDNVDAAESLNKLLTRRGHEVTVAHDGLQALLKSENLDLDIVLLDLGLPKIDGFRVARALRRQKRLRKLIIVAVTGENTAEDIQRAKDAGVDHHLAKPLDPDNLWKLLKGL